MVHAAYALAQAMIADPQNSSAAPDHFRRVSISSSTSQIRASRSDDAELNSIAGL